MCVPCDQGSEKIEGCNHCSNFNSSNTCHACDTEKFIYQGEAEKPICKRKCNSVGQYWDSPNTCVPCPDIHCENCQESTGFCEKCFSGFEKKEYCKRKCKLGQYHTGKITNLCKVCGAHCLSCLDSTAHCQLCEDGFFLHPDGTELINCQKLLKTLSIKNIIFKKEQQQLVLVFNESITLLKKEAFILTLNLPNKKVEVLEPQSISLNESKMKVIF